jgi:hypothetical protein
MRIRTFTLLIILFSLQLKAQFKGTIINQKDKKLIPYANIWIENENVGTTADENGKFELPNFKENQRLIINALGYQNITLAFADAKDVIELLPIVYELNEVKVDSKKKNLELKIGNFKGLKLNTFLACGLKYPHVVARYFPYQEAYQNTPFIKEIMPYCTNRIKEAKFRVRIFEAKTNGEPGDELLNSDLIVSVKKGNSKPVINLENYNIIFPEHGIFIGLEFLFIKSNINIYEASYNYNGEKGIKKMTNLEPSFAVIKGKSEKSETWKFSESKWTKRASPIGLFSAENKDLLAIELTLTN